MKNLDDNNLLYNEEKYYKIIIFIDSRLDSEYKKEKTFQHYLFTTMLMLSNWDCEDYGDIIQYKELKEFILDFYESNDLKKSNKNIKFYFGYFMSLKPEIFVSQKHSIGNIENFGKLLLSDLYEKNKDNLLYKYFYLGLDKPTKEYFKCKEKLEKNYKEYLDEDTEIGRYFIECIKCKI